MKKLTQPFALVTYGLILLFILINFSSVAVFWGQLITLINPFLWGFALAYLLNIPYEFFLHKVFHTEETSPHYKKIKLASLLLSYLLFFVVIIFIISMLVPQVIQSINLFIANSSTYYNDLQLFFNNLISKLQLQSSLWEEIQKAIMSLSEVIKNLLPSLIGIITNTASSVINLIGTLFISIYILSSKEKLMDLVDQTVRAFTSQRTQKYLHHVLEVTNQTFRGFIIGQLTDAIIIGIITFIGSSLLDFPYPILLGFLAGVTNVIPVIGPFIGAVPCALIILLVNPEKVILYIIFITILQQIDGNFIVPLVVGDSTGLDGLWILFAVIVGGGFFGIVGCLLAVPIFAILFKLYQEFLAHRLNKQPSPPH